MRNTVKEPTNGAIIADVYVPTWAPGDRAFLMIKGKLPKEKLLIGHIVRGETEVEIWLG